ncbi:RING/U-box superfamily protein [Forsythia ovata]|uniref:RING-type E3 ubiquitin transferase n=1 Tax=Forsythia ovata TaxID=205694 RepID=A0ABD1SJA1_9LAMI
MVRITGAATEIQFGMKLPVDKPHDSTLFHGIAQYNGAQLQHPFSNLNLAVAAPSGPYNPYMVPPYGIRDISFLVNHGAHIQLSLASTHGIVGIPTVSYGSNIVYMDGVRGSFNRKNDEGFPVNYQYHNASARSSSSVAPMTARPAERDVDSMIVTSFPPPEYGGNEPTTSMVENESQKSSRNRSVYPTCLSARVHGACVEAGNVGIQGYQVTPGSRSASSSSHPSIPQGHPNLHYLPLPMQGIKGYNINFPSQVATSSHRILTSSNTNSIPYQGVVGAEQTLLAPVTSTGFQLYQPQQREVILDSNARHQNLPNMRLLLEDLQELLALGEQIGIVGTGFSEEDVQNSLKTRTFSSLATCSNHEEAAQVDQQSNFCVICQISEPFSPDGAQLTALRSSGKMLLKED